MAIPAMTLVTLALVLPDVDRVGAADFSRRAEGRTGCRAIWTMRLERMEQAVDTIAIEVERVSEGQRFVTKVLAGRPVSDVE